VGLTFTALLLAEAAPAVFEYGKMTINQALENLRSSNALNNARNLKNLMNSGGLQPAFAGVPSDAVAVPSSPAIALETDVTVGLDIATYTQYSDVFGNTVYTITNNSGFGGMPEGMGKSIDNVYDSIKKSPNYPQGFETVKNGTTKNTVKNKQLLEKLREVESGTWKKIYKDGYDTSGNKISIHYFQSQSGKVFNVKVKSGWSNY
ncbi:hypothetical protein, partial [Abyssisolibacter fermentans]|uniref:hypothetical protein n=1 Tax=Abyssisolibacter fermentans TaxID=1766203 RepID=UPI003B8346A2